MSDTLIRDEVAPRQDVPDLTLAVCAYNAARRLPAVLEAFARQRVRAGISWEIIVVDNASSDGTGDVARELSSRLKLGVRVVLEQRRGLANARHRAVEEARGEILSFVDDDNIIEMDWVEQCVDFMRGHPKAGVIGGRIDAIFEEPASRPADFDERYAGALAVWNLGPEAFQLVPPKNDPPCGAGLTLRTELVRRVFRQFGCHLSGRKGTKLVSGEDYEIGLLIMRLGGEAWYTPTLRMGHVLPPFRLTENYLKRLHIGNFQGEAWLNYLRGMEPRRNRWVYLAQAIRWWLMATKMKVVGWVRRSGHADSANYPLWAQAAMYRAAGAWGLFSRYPFRRLEAVPAARAD